MPRLQAARLWWTLGDRDGAFLLEAPDNVAVVALSMAVGASGDISTENTVLLDMDEALEAMRRAAAATFPSAELIGGPAVHRDSTMTPLHTAARGATYARVAQLPLAIERCDLLPLVRDTSSGFTKVSIVVRLSGGGHGSGTGASSSGSTSSTSIAC